MWYILILLCVLHQTNICLSKPITTDREFYYYDQQQIQSLKSIDSNNTNHLVNLKLSPINNDNVSLNICSIQLINIDQITNQNDSNNRLSTKINTLNFISSWKQFVEEIPDNDENHDDSTVLNIIEITFTIPYKISNESIIDKAIFIRDITNNQLIATLTDFCYNESSFILNYSTIQPLPHDICLYLLLNLTSSTSLQEISVCRIIEDSYNNTSILNDTIIELIHDVGPSAFFILSQGIIILIMMFIIYVVQTARQKSFLNRVSQQLVHCRPYITIFGNKTVVRASNGSVSVTLNPATTLHAGLNSFTFNRRLASVSAPVEEQVLAATDLTSTLNDRRASRAYLNHDLLNIREFTRRMSTTNESLEDEELHKI